MYHVLRVMHFNPVTHPCRLSQVSSHASSSSSLLLVRAAPQHASLSGTGHVASPCAREAVKATDAHWFPTSCKQG